MKYFIAFIIAASILSCNQADKKAKEQPGTTIDSLPPVIDSKTGTSGPTTVTDSSKQNSIPLTEVDAALLKVSRKILTVIKANDFTQLASFIHPKYGLLFSPYGYIDSAESVTVNSKQLSSSSWQQKIRKWGTYDGREDPIRMNLTDYSAKFIYPIDFLTAKIISVNQSHGGGNSLNNLRTLYPADSFTEFYFPGFDPKYDGMDFQLLRLVFRKENNKTWLIAIVHDQWTI